MLLTHLSSSRPSLAEIVQPMVLTPVYMQTRQTRDKNKAPKNARTSKTGACLALHRRGNTYRL